MGAKDMNRTITSLAAALAAAIALAPMAQAQAETPDVITVTAAGVNLDTQAGARTMLTRIDSAATTACWQDKLDKMDAYRNCKAGVILDAVKVLDEPMVSLVYAETYSTRKAPTMVLASR
jgi:UrcA family protein